VQTSKQIHGLEKRDDLQGSPVGVFDSGYGGLSVLRALRQKLPSVNFTYLGDSGRAPYGGRDLDTVLDFAEQCVERLFLEGCRSWWSPATRSRAWRCGICSIVMAATTGEFSA
jgi:hypothetical protein